MQGFSVVMVAIFGVFFLLLFGGAIALIVSRVRGARRTRDALEVAWEQVASDGGLQRVEHPLGLADIELVHTFEMLPRGDGEHSAVWAMEAPTQLTLGDRTVTVECAAFEWWWEFAVGDDGTQGRGDLQVVVVQVPGVDMPPIRVAREGPLTRAGWTRGDDLKVESERLNAALDIRGADPGRSIRLFDPGFQVALLERWEGWSFELVGDLALLCPHVPAMHWSTNPGVMPRRGPGGLFGLGSRDGDRVGEDPDVIARLPGIGRDALALLATMPASWWRAVTKVQA